MQDKSGKPRFNKTTAFELVASLQLTMKDVFRFSVELNPACDDDDDDPREHVLQMVDCRNSETRALYRRAALEFLEEYLPNTYIKDNHIPFWHLGTVLQRLYDDREAAIDSCNTGKDPLTLTQIEKAKIPVVVLDAS